MVTIGSYLLILDGHILIVLDIHIRLVPYLQLPYLNPTCIFASTGPPLTSLLKIIPINPDLIPPFRPECIVNSRVQEYANSIAGTFGLSDYCPDPHRHPTGHGSDTTKSKQ